MKNLLKPPTCLITNTLLHLKRDIIAMALLLCITIAIQGCATAKCDCPTFGGHHLKH